MLYVVVHTRLAQVMTLSRPCAPPSEYWGWLWTAIFSLQNISLATKSKIGAKGLTRKFERQLTVARAGSVGHARVWIGTMVFCACGMLVFRSDRRLSICDRENT
ncbi:hypothetical protein M433DRAFT_381629 [Acidomyces richmondensis BFW]|nr:MAG: hypothetical protein FE78DRAFT_521418 [Acidomyces sp. 'richmondensis']KYG42912.1 hypothetical protein M433DRAFT_381629 [Acidomyces richmondensis BFW]